jgi:hypothetical protein
MLRHDTKIVDVELAPCPLELVQFGGDEASYDVLAGLRHESNDVLLREQALQVGITRWHDQDEGRQS